MKHSTRRKSLLLGMLSRWREEISPGVRRTDPLLLLRLLDSVGETDWISQADLRRKLSFGQSRQFGQSRLSKLLAVLINAGYLEDSDSADDQRLQMLSLTESGKEILYYLESTISEEAQLDLRHSSVPVTAAPHVYRG